MKPSLLTSWRGLLAAAERDLGTRLFNHLVGIAAVVVVVVDAVALAALLA